MTEEELKKLKFESELTGMAFALSWVLEVLRGETESILSYQNYRCNEIKELVSKLKLAAEGKKE